MAHVLSVHTRVLRRSTAADVGALIDSLASDDDRLWPHQLWPAMVLDRPLGVGAVGGHGPIRYEITEYEPGQRVTFRFLGPRGFDGTHALDLTTRADGVVLRHVLSMETRGLAVLSWPAVFSPLHDALLEDALDRAELAIDGRVAQPARWSLRVRILREILGRVLPSPQRVVASYAPSRS